jgi:hypothetical protein
MYGANVTPCSILVSVKLMVIASLDTKILVIVQPSDILFYGNQIPREKEK